MENLKALWNGLPEGVKRVVHTFWQAAGSVFLTALFAAHSPADVKAGLFVALSSGLAAVKALVLAR